MTLYDCFLDIKMCDRAFVFCFFTAVDATLQEMGAYLLLPKTTKVHAALPTNLMACTVIHKTYINITLHPIVLTGFAAQCVRICIRLYTKYTIITFFKQSAISNLKKKKEFNNSIHCHSRPLTTS